MHRNAGCSQSSYDRMRAAVEPDGCHTDVMPAPTVANGESFNNSLEAARRGRRGDMQNSQW